MTLGEISGTVDPAFPIARMRFPLDGELDLLFEKNDFYWLFENDLESPLIFVLFLKGKQNKKENPKYDSWFLEKVVCENRIRFGGQVTYRDGTVKTVAPL